jgi:hypothetical protein
LFIKELKIIKDRVDRGRCERSGVKSIDGRKRSRLFVVYSLLSWTRREKIWRSWKQWTALT